MVRLAYIGLRLDSGVHLRGNLGSGYDFECHALTELPAFNPVSKFTASPVGIVDRKANF